MVRLPLTGARRVARAWSLALLLARVCAACSSSSDANHAKGIGDASTRADSGASSSRDNDASISASDASASEPSEPMQVLVTGEDGPFALAIDDRYVYWTTTNTVRRAPLAGGEAVTLATGTAIRRLVVAEGSVFFTDGLANTVSRVDRDGKHVTVIGTGIQPDGIAVAEHQVYWTNSGMTAGAGADGSLATTAADAAGASMKILLDGLSQPAGVAVADGFVYFTGTSSECSASSSSAPSCSAGGVRRYSLADKTTEVVEAEDTPYYLVAGKRGVYWMGSRLQLKFAPAGRAPARILADLVGDGSGAMALDDDALYLSSDQRGRVLKIALDGGKPQVLVTDLGTSGGIAVDDHWVYVAAPTQGRILRVAKDGSASKPSGPITGPCPMPQGSEKEIAATPREDQNLEMLALHLEADRITADQETYDRVLADVKAIRELVPDLADIGYFAPNDGKTVSLRPNEITYLSVQAGDYSAWDCLNDFYGIQSIMVEPGDPGDSSVLLTLKGRYNMDRVAAVYAQLPGIQSAEPNWIGSDGPTICGLRGTSAIEYVFDRASGDCAGGCTTHEARLFESTAPGVIESKQAWSSDTGVAPPAWFSRVCTR